MHANLANHGGDLDRYLTRLPLERVVYMHAAGGARIESTGMYRDTHAHRIDAPVVHTLAQILARTGPVPLLLERDGHYDLQLDAELDDLAAVLAAATDPIAAPAAPRPALELPVVDRALREHLAARHTLLLDTLANSSGPSHGFDTRHLAETREILGNKRTRLARKHGTLLR